MFDVARPLQLGQVQSALRDLLVTSEMFTTCKTPVTVASVHRATTAVRPLAFPNGDAPDPTAVPKTTVIATASVVRAVPPTSGASVADEGLMSGGEADLDDLIDSADGHAGGSIGSVGALGLAGLDLDYDLQVRVCLVDHILEGQPRSHRGGATPSSFQVMSPAWGSPVSVNG